MDTLARIEAGLAEVLAGRDAPELARDLAALAHSDWLEVTAEVASPSEMPLAAKLGAHAIRVDAELAIPPAAMRACLLIGGHLRRAQLEALRAAVAERAAAYVATDLEIAVALGTRPARAHFPRSELRAVELAGAARAGAIAAMTARAGRLGVRGARWIAADPELFAAIAGGWLAAARDRGRPARVAFVVPAVAFPSELAPVRTLLQRLARDEGVAIAIGASVETVRGVLAIEAIERAADFVEIDLEALAETATCAAAGDARALAPMLERELLPLDPFAELDPVLAALLVAARRPGRSATVRGGCVLGPRTLARLYELAIGSVCVRARDAGAARLAHARHSV